LEEDEEEKEGEKSTAIADCGLRPVKFAPHCTAEVQIGSFEVQSSEFGILRIE